MDHRGDVFSRLPPEILQHIAVAACGSTPVGPPSELAALLRVCRTVYRVLCVQQNPGLHARIFCVQFDSQAPIRRFADAGQPLNAYNLAHELQRRWIGLKRIQDVANSGSLAVYSGEEQLLGDLWMIYLMFLESDGRNAEQILWARVSRYSRIVVAERVWPLPPTGYPEESTTQAIGMWLMWFYTEINLVVAEAPSDAGPIRAMLRRWALATHKYDVLSAPYTHWTLPSPNEHDLGENPPIATPENLDDLSLRDRTEVVLHMGHHLRLAPPRAAFAAIMAFMVRIERNGPIPARPTIPIPAPLVKLPPAGQPYPPGLTVYPRTRYPTFGGPGSLEFDGRVNVQGSAAYDADWRRLLQCGNPLSRPMFKTPPMFRPGELAGQWEGRVVFPTMDAFRDMLAGVPDAVTNGHIAQQPQVLELREHHLISRRRRFPLGHESDLIIGEQIPVGGALDAFIPRDAEFFQHESRGFGPRHLEVRVPDATGPLGYRSYSYITVDNPRETHPTTLGDGDYEYDEEIVDTLITGEGRSSWGPFKLRGRIRAWDGLIVLVKDYGAPITQGRGRWLYKGYLGSGSNWVGRWRDTFTEERLCGYEGIFSIARKY